MEEVGHIIDRNIEYFNKLTNEISIASDIEGKGLLNSNIDKLFKSNKYVKGEKHFEEIVTYCQVIINKMSTFKSCRWKPSDLTATLEMGIEYYRDGLDNSVSEFYNRHPNYKSVDGHIVISKSELIIDLWLCHHKIEHVYEKQIQKNGKSVIKCDFYLPTFNLYIEYWGLEGDTAYEQRKKEKEILYNTLGLRLLSIYPEDLLDLDNNVLWKIQNIP